MASWRRQATSISTCCGTWPHLTINCSSANPLPPPPTTIPHTEAACDIVTDSRWTAGDSCVTALEIDLTDQYNVRKIGANIPAAVCNLSALSSLRLVSLPLSGPIPECIATNLTNLVELDLSYNALTGSIPASLFLAHHLQVLDLSVNALTGSIPPSLALSRHLQVLRLFRNSLSGSIPSVLILPNLTSLHLSNNALSGPLPSFHAPKLSTLSVSRNHISGSLLPLLHASNLSSLAHLYLSNNKFRGSVPAALLCCALETLDISHNEFSGNINHLITHLDLQGCNLSGLTFLDFSYNQLTGALPGWLGAFSNLQFLSLANNSLHSSILPKAWKNLTSLSQLDLSGTPLLEPNFTHAPKLPCWLFSFPKLVVLTLSSTGLQDSDMDPEKLCAGASGNLSLHLSSLDLSWNSFTASLLHTFVAKTQIFDHTLVAKTQIFDPKPEGNLDLSGNPLETDLSDPSVVESLILTQLPGRLAMSHCSLRGQLPGLFFSKFVASLSFLSLDHNHLHGPIPPFVGNVSNLEFLDLSYNHLHGPIPPFVGNVSNLVDLDLSHNHLHGPIPPFVGNVPNLQYLYLSHNHLHGPIPSSFVGNMSNLVDLDLSHNHLHGPIPSFVGNMSYLEFLDLSQNHLHGPIPPSEVGNLSNLYYLDLSYNHLHGPIPSEVGNLSNLESLFLGHNLLIGSLSDIGPLIPPSLQLLSLTNNQLIGQIPSSLRNLTNLQLLDLSHNKLHGNLQYFFSTAAYGKHYSDLRILLLAENLFTGPIPTTLGDIAPALQIIDFSNNLLTGSIPMHTLLSLRALTSMNLPGATDKVNSNLELSDEIYAAIDLVVKGIVQEYTYILAGLTSLDFSNNKLNGCIPTGLGGLSGLIMLNLSHNNLSGTIPSDLGSLVQLESLDLSSNMLEGSIPVTFTNLTKLGVFNVSYNPRLSGPIITNNPQMDNNYSYIGDPKLCGSPILLNACTPPSAQGNPDHQTTFSWKNGITRFVDEWVSVSGLCLGIVGGFLGCVWLLNALGWYR